MVSGRSESSSGGKKTARKHSLGLIKSKSIMAPCCRAKSRKNRSSVVVRHTARELGYNVDVADLLFTPERDFLITNSGRKVRVNDLKGKTIVLYMVPVYEFFVNSGDHLDMVQAYNELLFLCDFEFEFVFVPVYLDYITKMCDNYPLNNPRFASQEAVFNHLLSTLPWPAVPFSDVGVSGGRVVQTFSVDDRAMYIYSTPYWVIIDPTGIVVAMRGLYHNLFKLFGGLELYPLSRERIFSLWMSMILLFVGSDLLASGISSWHPLLVILYSRATTTRYPSSFLKARS